MKRMLMVICAVVMLFSCHTSRKVAENKVSMPAAYQKKNFQSSTIDLPYNILTPPKIEGKIPLVIFLHGAGERGNDNNSQLVHGSKLFLDSLATFPAVYLFPQCPKDGYWANVEIDREVMPLKLHFMPESPATPALQAVIELIDQTGKDYPIDKSQIKIIGLSMGGMGIFEILHRRPELFESAIAICGGGSPEAVKKYNKKLRLWIAHGLADNVILPIESDKMYAAAKSKGIQTRYSKYNGVGHNSWDRVFAEPDYLQWLFR